MKYTELTPDQVDAAMTTAEAIVSMGVSEMVKGGHCDLSVMMYENINRGLATARELAIVMGADPQHYAYHFTALLANALVQFNVDNVKGGEVSGVAQGVGVMAMNFNSFVADQLSDVVSGKLVNVRPGLNS